MNGWLDECMNDPNYEYEGLNAWTKGKDGSSMDKLPFT